MKANSILKLESNAFLSHCGILGRDTVHFILHRNFSLIILMSYVLEDDFMLP